MWGGCHVTVGICMFQWFRVRKLPGNKEHLNVFSLFYLHFCTCDFTGSDRAAINSKIKTAHHPSPVSQKSMACAPSPQIVPGLLIGSPLNWSPIKLSAHLTFFPSSLSCLVKYPLS